MDAFEALAFWVGVLMVLAGCYSATSEPRLVARAGVAAAVGFLLIVWSAYSMGAA